MMTRAVVERIFDTPLGRNENPIPRGCCDCFTLQRVEWLSALVSVDGKRALLTCLVPDLESLRMAIRHCPVNIRQLFPFEEFAFKPGALPDQVTEFTLSEDSERHKLLAWASSEVTTGVVRLWMDRHTNRGILLSRKSPDLASGPGITIHNQWVNRTPFALETPELSAYLLNPGAHGGP